MRLPTYFAAVLTIAASLGVCRVSTGQIILDIQWLPTGDGNYNVGTNWSNEGFGAHVPDASQNETGNIINGGTAQLGDTAPNVGGLTIGPGALEVIGPGSLTVSTGPSLTGAANVGSDGSLSVGPAGTFAAESVQNSGTLLLTGDNATFNVTNNLVLDTTSTLAAEINAGTHSAISVGGGATLSGNVDAQFNGVNPLPGDTWDLVDAASFTGGFDAVTSNLSLGPGQVLGTRQVVGGTNGMLAQLVFEQRLTLNVDRESKIVSLENPGAAPVSIDGYRIGSAVGSINSIPWTSFADLGLDGGTWLEAGGGGTANQLAELNPDTTAAISDSSARAIGAVFQPNFVTLGQETEDLVFTYTNLDDEIIEGTVNYVGRKEHNNLVLVVDPASGAGRMQNESGLTVDIDGYTVTSASGALLDTWNSLQDQGAAGGDWFEGNPSQMQLAELQSDGVTTLNQGDGFNLGTLFNTSLSQDLQFEFLLTGSQLGFTGVVEYDSLASAIAGDYSNNGIVALEDLNLVLFNWQAPGAGLPGEWINFRPSGNVGLPELNGVLFNWQNTAAIGTVPEPSSLVMLVTVLLPSVVIRSLRQ
jgi:hypothetical protein